MALQLAEGRRPLLAIHRLACPPEERSSAAASGAAAFGPAVLASAVALVVRGIGGAAPARAVVEPPAEGPLTSTGGEEAVVAELVR